MSIFTQATTDGLVMAKRNLIKVKRIPDLLIFTTIQPVMFVLLFAYVFGGAIHPDGVNYREFLMAGIFTQTVAFGSAITRPEVYRSCAEPGIRLAAEPDSEVHALPSVGSIFAGRETAVATMTLASWRASRIDDRLSPIWVSAP